MSTGTYLGKGSDSTVAEVTARRSGTSYHHETRPRPRRADDGARTLSLVGVFAVFALYAVPLVYVLISSFKSNIDIANHPLALIFTPTVAAYHAILNRALLAAVGNSLLITGIATGVTLIGAIPLTYVLTRIHPRWTGLIVGVLIVLQMVPSSTAVIPLYSLLPALGLINTIPGVALSIAAGTLPFAVLLLRPFYVSVPREVQEAAEVDGAGPFRSFFSITMPLVRNGILVITILVFIGAWGEFLFAMSFLGDESKYPISVLLVQQQSQYGTQYSNLMALSLIGAIPTIILFLFAAKRLTSGLALGAGK